MPVSDDVCRKILVQSIGQFLKRPTCRRVLYGPVTVGVSISQQGNGNFEVEGEEEMVQQFAPLSPLSAIDLCHSDSTEHLLSNISYQTDRRGSIPKFIGRISKRVTFAALHGKKKASHNSNFYEEP